MTQLHDYLDLFFTLNQDSHFSIPPPTPKRGDMTQIWLWAKRNCYPSNLEAIKQLYYRPMATNSTLKCCQFYDLLHGKTIGSFGDTDIIFRFTPEVSRVNQTVKLNPTKPALTIQWVWWTFIKEFYIEEFYLNKQAFFSCVYKCDDKGKDFINTTSRVTS